MALAGACIAVLLAALPHTADAANSDAVPLGDAVVTTINSSVRPEGFTAPAISEDGRFAVFAGISDRSLTILDLQTGESKKIDSIGSVPWHAAITSNGATAYVLDLQSEELVAIDTSTLGIRSRIKFADYAGNASFALSPDGSKAYVVVTRAILPPSPARNELVVVNLDTGAVEKSIELSSVVTPNALTRASKRVVAPSNSPFVYVADNLSRGIHVVDPASGSVVRTLPFNGDPASLAVTEDGSQVIALSKDRDVVSLLDGASGQQLWESSTYPGSPGGAVIDEANGFAYVTLEYTGTIVRFDLETGASERRSLSSMQFGTPALINGGRTIAIPITPTSVLLLQPNASMRKSQVRLPSPERVRAQWKNGAVNVFWSPVVRNSLPPAEAYTVSTRPKTSACRVERNNCVFANLEPGQTYRFVVSAHLGDQRSKPAISRPFTVPD